MLNNTGSTQGPNARVIAGAGWSASIDGTVPVQGEGTVDGQPMFFRARYRSWTLAIDGGDTDYVYGAEPYPVTDPFGAGYMSDAEASACIEAAIAMHRANKA